MRDPNHTRTGINIHSSEGAEFRAKFRTFRDPKVVAFELDVGDDGLVIFLPHADIDRFKKTVFKSMLVSDGPTGGECKVPV